MKHSSLASAQPYTVAKRVLDLLILALATPVLVLPMLMIALCIRTTSSGPVLYWSRRVGQNNNLFWMPKFRSMQNGTPAVATHLLTSPERHLTPIGSFLRKTSLDELPQFWCILKGEMSVVGPRPALFNQDDLVAARTERDVHTLLPGLTGWAQVNGRDELSIVDKVTLDADYLMQRSFLFDLRILLMTVIRVIGVAGVKH